ncbi:MAG: nucleoside deaminase [Flavobacterium piscis]|mgnify:CR=1 FL=1|nr:nucleoside deaminase [Flavobacterium piscis]HOP49843.1 nucleoside deaminase [Ignavibacteriales bacterium]
MGVVLKNPDWIEEFVASYERSFDRLVDRMKFAIDLSEKNVMLGTGGPFGAAIFEKESGKLIACGVNQVVELNKSIAHAEIMAILHAQEKLKTYDLGNPELPDLQLVTSSQMCVMCFGAVLWSGVKSVVIGARGIDVESSCGFDEGPLHPNWVEELEKRGIEVIQDVLRPDAIAVLKMYKRLNAVVYNASRGTKC